ncbi:hypothetical protein AVEN_235192-1 [Araneus ventricosus]|uniref:Reverse transcriptase domain-containing protein n=1 Tax=Araneus ventricosus TaxID=182803 RepID=A0A4Y2LWU5_ARAVE|nr:hypothetical protein AVEN_235192-1 [Araneus ventricosus]
MGISLDIQWAFDHLQHSSIHNSINAPDFPSNTKETLKDILRYRGVGMQISQSPVFWRPKQQGCAQVSCTGPLFWNMATNEILSENWQAGVPLQAFADDFVFVISEPTGGKLKSTAHEALAVFKRTDKHKLLVSIKNPAIF